MGIGDMVRLIRFGRVGMIVDIEQSNNRDVYIVQYNEHESEELYEWELELA
jgi:hypothetical protein